VSSSFRSGLVVALFILPLFLEASWYLPQLASLHIQTDQAGYGWARGEAGGVYVMGATDDSLKFYPN